MKMYKLTLGIIMALMLVTLSSGVVADLAFDSNCPVDTATYVNFTNGTSVFLPFTYNETATTSSNLTVFLGTSTSDFCNSIDANLSTFTANRNVIFTPEFLNALKTSTCNVTFENYMQNYRKSGNILNSSGTVFCGMKNITFSLATNPSGITFDYPHRNNITISSVSYNSTDLKKYALAYIMNNPTATLSGIISTLASAIDQNLLSTCSDVSTTTEFFNAGKGNYTSKFYPSILGVNWTSGEQLKPSQGTGGIVGWLLDYALGNQTLPVITAVNLSASKIHVCGLITVSGSYIDSTLTISTNYSFVNGTNSVNTTLDLITAGSVTNSTLELVSYPTNPRTSGVASLTALNKYIGIRMDSALESVFSSAIIKIYYTDAEVSAVGLTETSLILYYYNDTSASWVSYSSPNGGVDTTANYVWANTTHFSDWGIFGSVASTTTTTATSTSFVSGCSIKWECGSWTACINDKQTRTCSNLGTCAFKPKTETQECTIVSLPVIRSTIPNTILPPEIKEESVPLGTSYLSLIFGAILIGLIVWKFLEDNHFPKKKKKR